MPASDGIMIPEVHGAVLILVISRGDGQKGKRMLAVPSVVAEITGEGYGSQLERVLAKGLQVLRNKDKLAW